MNKSKSDRIATWLFNPFYYWGGSKLLWIGAGVILLHFPLAYLFDVRFAGAIDMHVTGVQPALFTIFSDVSVAWISMSLFLYASAKMFRSPIRLIDIFGAVGLARFPLLIAIFPAIVFAPDTTDIEELMSIQGAELAWLIAGAFVILLFLIWFFILLFNAYKINSNLKGWKLGVGFVSAVIVAEAVSLFILRYLLG